MLGYVKSFAPAEVVDEDGEPVLELKGKQVMTGHLTLFLACFSVIFSRF